MISSKNEKNFEETRVFSVRMKVLLAKRMKVFCVDNEITIAKFLEDCVSKELDLLDRKSSGENK